MARLFADVKSKFYCGGSMRLRKLIFVIAFLGMVANPACAQSTAAVTPTPTPAPGVAPGTPGAAAGPSDCAVAKGKLPEVKIAQVFRVFTIPPTAEELKAAQKEPHPLVGLRQHIGVKVDKLNILLKHAQCLNKNVVLFLDARAMKDLKPFPESDPDQNILYFELKRTEASRETWTYLLGKPRVAPRRVAVSVGLEDEYAMRALDTESKGEHPSISLNVMPTGRLASSAAVALFLVIGGLLLARKSDMLRDSGPPPLTGRKAYSLARVQLATWTFLVLVSYLFIGLITGDYTSSVTDSVLALMGISAGTAIGSSIIDSSPSRTDGQAAAAGAPAAPPLPPEQAVPDMKRASPTTGRWWMDILTDDEGVNFHRFQMAAWTLVLGIVFLRQVYNELAMPEFNANLLALIGISSGTYLGLKITSEKPAGS
jgi:hypothetical protein